jgi:ribosomal protein S19
MFLARNIKTFEMINYACGYILFLVQTWKSTPDGSSKRSGRGSLSLDDNGKTFNRTANEKPNVVKTHLRNMVVVPEMTGSVVGVYNGKTFNQDETKPETIGHYLREFFISYWKILWQKNQARRTFRKFTYRGVELHQFLDTNHEQLIGVLPVQDQEKVLPWPERNITVKRQAEILNRLTRSYAKEAGGGPYH